jgi:hypothetical protein
MQVDVGYNLHTQFKGQVYSQEVAKQIKEAADSNGLEVLPWPKGVSMVSAELNTIAVILNNDIDMIIDEIFLMV